MLCCTRVAGNDFIPHLPSMDIGEGALNKLFELYRDLVPRLGGYFTEGGIVRGAWGWSWQHYTMQASA